MINFPVTQPSARSLGLARAAEAMLRALGGSEVVFRVQAQMSPAESDHGLGLTAPLTEDVAIAPVVVCAVAPDEGEATRFELLLAPNALSAALTARGQTAEEFFATTVGVLHPLTAQESAEEPALLHLESVGVELLAGVAYLYRVRVSE